MTRWRYSRWDGSQEQFSLDAREALDALGDLLMEGLDVDEALAWMRQQGFSLAGLDMRVMGLEELADQLRREVAELEDRYHLRDATSDLERRLDAILEREQQALTDAHGHESARMNDFLARRHADRPHLADRIDAFRDHAFEDPAAGEDFRELLGELEALRDLEAFRDARGERFRGAEAADYATAQSLRRRIEALEQLARELAAGRIDGLEPARLEDLLGEAGVQSLVLLQGLEDRLRDAGYLRGGPAGAELTPRAIRRLGEQALAEVYTDLRRGRRGSHDTHGRGAAIPRPDETRPFVFGDPLDLDPVRTLVNAVQRLARDDVGRPLPSPIPLEVDDFAVRQRDTSTHTTTVLLLDMSWSMSWAGRFPAAKRVALALDHLVRTRFPRDDFFVVGFSTRARELRIGELPVACWDAGDPFTNLQDGLQVAERLISRHPSPSPQILVVTDGQPTAYRAAGELHVEWPMGFGGVSPHAVAETLRTVRRITRRGITINTFMLDDAPELVGFVERMTEINAGRAFYTTPGHLGRFLMVDFVKRRRAGRRA